MRTIVFHPEWGVPDSIKVKELAPYLSGGGGGGFLFFGGGDTSILDRQRMRVVYNGRPVNPSSVDWGQVDIRRFTFIQSAGPHNVLGVVKFMFPNKHDIYMHDTPQRELLDQPQAHVQPRLHARAEPGAPGRAAARRGQGLAGRAGARPAGAGLQQRGRSSPSEIPVHVTYFTAVAGEGGQVSSYGDIYGYDSRMSAALGGKPLPRRGRRQRRRPAPRRAPRRRQQKQPDFFSGLFGN